MIRHCQATEQQSRRQVRAGLTDAQTHLAKILFRLRAVVDLPERPRLLDLGAAQGRILIAADRLGLQAVGVEPYAPARKDALALAEELGVAVDIRPGWAESLDLPDASFDIVHALSVLEHVNDPMAVFADAHRVLRPGGVLWFCTTNGLCPRQNEIAYWPGFGWYPIRLKRRIMRWTARNRPAWIGHTDAPAMHWFTPGSTRRMLRQVGFDRIYDRWDLRRSDEGGRLHAVTLRAIRRWRPLRLLAEMGVPASIYAAVKPAEKG